MFSSITQQDKLGSGDAHSQKLTTENSELKEELQGLEKDNTDLDRELKDVRLQIAGLSGLLHW